MAAIRCSGAGSRLDARFDPYTHPELSQLAGHIRDARQNHRPAFFVDPNLFFGHALVIAEYDLDAPLDTGLGLRISRSLAEIR